MIDPTDDELRAFIEESLPPERLNELLRRLPEDPQLQKRLAAIREESPVGITAKIGRPAARYSNIFPGTTRSAPGTSLNSRHCASALTIR